MIEITETVLLTDMPVACTHLERIREGSGSRVAIDDFGTGFTSLATLRQLPVDILKIDRSLVGDIQEPIKGRSVVRLIIEAAHVFGLGVTAEGVETDAQRRVLCELDCERVQGWLFSAAVPADKARQLIA